MKNANEKEGTQIFTSDDQKTLQEAIITTQPGWDAEKGTVSQPNLNDQSSLVARAVALADIGTAGMDGAKKFLSEGDPLFREENLDILDGLQKGEKLTQEQKEYFRSRIFAWTKSELAFAIGRRALLDEELSPMPRKAQDAVRLLFSKFDDSIFALGELIDKRKGMSFGQIAQSIGYVL